MSKSRSGRTILSATTVGLAALLVVSTPVEGASVTRTSGSGHFVNVSWTEYDPEDLLGLPGNVHVGYLYLDNGPYGSYFGGNVTDFECDEGETPWGGHGLPQEVVDQSGELVADAAEDAIDRIIESGAATIDADLVADAVKSELAAGVAEIVEDEFEEIPACDWLQDRLLSAQDPDGRDTITVAVDIEAQTARIFGSIIVSHGGHGEPTQVLGTPPIDLTISGGEWSTYEYSTKYASQDYRYSHWQAGTNYDGGPITGGIGAMGFADDQDDEGYGGYGDYRFRTVDRVRES